MLKNQRDREPHKPNNEVEIPMKYNNTKLKEAC